jgi:hypothetical protein
MALSLLRLCQHTIQKPPVSGPVLARGLSSWAWVDLVAFARELARLKAKELPHLPLQLLAFRLYRLYRLGKIYKMSISQPYK